MFPARSSNAASSIHDPQEAVTDLFLGLAQTFP